MPFGLGYGACSNRCPSNKYWLRIGILFAVGYGYNSIGRGRSEEANPCEWKWGIPAKNPEVTECN